jgi:hypothetical protein
MTWRRQLHPGGAHEERPQDLVPVHDRSTPRLVERDRRRRGTAHWARNPGSTARKQTTAPAEARRKPVGSCDSDCVTCPPQVCPAAGADRSRNGGFPGRTVRFGPSCSPSASSNASKGVSGRVTASQSVTSSRASRSIVAASNSWVL